MGISEVPGELHAVALSPNHLLGGGCNVNRRQSPSACEKKQAKSERNFQFFSRFFKAACCSLCSLAWDKQRHFKAGYNSKRL